jgi:hypothetical protein
MAGLGIDYCVEEFKVALTSFELRSISFLAVAILSLSSSYA